jgi:imidazolonepropionase-like amidohydrolase
MLDPGTALRDILLRSSARKVLDGLRNAAIMLQAGFTTVRSLGDVDSSYGLVELRDAIAREEFPGPRLVVAPHFISTTGGHGDLSEFSPEVPPLALAIIADGVDDLRRAIRREVKYGADWIKLFVSGGILSSSDSPDMVSYSDEELRAAVDEAHRLGRKVAVHAMGTASIKAALRAGVDDIEHGFLIDDEGIRLLQERGAWLVPTAYLLRYLVVDGVGLGLSEGQLAKARDLMALRDDCQRRAFAAGVKVGFGTDNGPWPHGLAAREFGELVRLGLTPLAAIQAATVNAALALGLDREIGNVEVGMQADLIGIKGDPLDDITALERVAFVMQAGRVVKHQV